CLRHFDGGEMWKTGCFCRHLPGQNAPFSTCGQQSVKIRGSYPPCFPDSSVILWISHPLYFPSPAGERKIFSLLHKGQNSFFLAGRIAFGWSIDSPSRSQRYSWRLRFLTYEESRGHWNRPLSKRL